MKAANQLIGAGTIELVAEAIVFLEARGDGALDHTALLKLVEDLSGRSRGPVAV